MPLIQENDLLLEVPGWTNPRTRTGLDDESIKALGASILKEGLLYELLVWPVVVEGQPIKYMVIDGQRRLLAIRRLQKEWLFNPEGIPCPASGGIPCKVIEAPTFLAATYKALATYQREKLSSYELVVRLAEIKKQHGETNRKLAREVQKAEAWVSKMFKAAGHMSEALEVAWRGDRLTDEQVQLIAALPLEKQEKAIETSGRRTGTRGLRGGEVKEKAVLARSGEDLQELLAVVESWEAGPYKDGARDALLWGLKRPIAFKNRGTS